jgi:hypothetical protein
MTAPVASVTTPAIPPVTIDWAGTLNVTKNKNSSDNDAAFKSFFVIFSFPYLNRLRLSGDFGHTNPSPQ